jgi:hypothetical protein
MHLTIAICTHNRASMLAQTLRHVAALAAPACPWEVIVVANACTDGTRLVLDDFAGLLPLRVIEEPAPGLSHARNAAVAAAAGTYIVWTDDDVIVDPMWLVHYVEAFTAHPGAAFFGGPIEPLFTPSPPAWIVELLPQIGAAFARRQLGPNPFRVDQRTLPYGANYAVRADAQRRYAYDAAFGQRPGAIGLGEETMVLFSMLNDDEEGWWVPAARVSHVIPEARQQWNHVRAHWRAQGEALARQLDPPRGAQLLGRPFWLWRAVLECEARYLRGRLTRPRPQWIRELAEARIVWSAWKACADRPLPGAGRS